MNKEKDNLAPPGKHNVQPASSSAEDRVVERPSADARKAVGCDA